MKIVKTLLGTFAALGLIACGQDNVESPDLTVSSSASALTSGVEGSWTLISGEFPPFDSLVVRGDLYLADGRSYPVTGEGEVLTFVGREEGRIRVSPSALSFIAKPRSIGLNRYLGYQIVDGVLHVSADWTGSGAATYRRVEGCPLRKGCEELVSNDPVPPPPYYPGIPSD